MLSQGVDLKQYVCVCCEPHLHASDCTSLTYPLGCTRREQEGSGGHTLTLAHIQSTSGCTGPVKGHRIQLKQSMLELHAKLLLRQVCGRFHIDLAVSNIGRCCAGEAAGAFKRDRSSRDDTEGG